MARLSVYLPPFAGDYAGTSSVLFGLDCLVVVIDAGCCTRNYTEYDEARWTSRRKSTFSAQLRTMDAVLGDDARIVAQTLEAAEALRPSCIALVGTPVPAITGMDVAGMAHEIELACGVPAFGLATTGFASYEHGASLALAALCRRFARGDVPSVERVGGHVRANLLGAVPQDFVGDGSLEGLQRALGERGVEVVLNTAGDYSLDDVGAASGADASLAVSWSGLAAGRLLRERFGVPLVAACPMGAQGADEVVRALRAAAAGNVGGAADVADAQGEVEDAGDSACEPLLLVGDQVVMNSLRVALRARFAQRGPCPTIRVASFFALDPMLCEPGDCALDGEAALVRLAREHLGLACVGDPLLRRVPGIGDGPFLALPHGAVSSTLFAADTVPCANARFDRELDAFVERVRANW